MSLLHRYLLRNFAPAFGLSLVLLTAILMMGYFVRLFNLAILKGIPMAWILQCFALLLPYLLSLALPMAFLVALLMTLGHLSEDGEILALRASGFGSREILAPFLAAALLLSGLLLYFNHAVSPAGLRSFKNRYAEALSQLSELDPEPKTFLELGDWKLYAEQVDKARSALGGVRLFRKGDAMTVSARGGAYAVRRGSGIRLELEDGELSKPHARDPSRATVARFKRYRVFIPTVAAAALARIPDTQERTSRELRGFLAGTLPERDRRELRTELGIRSAAALSPFVFFWIGCPLALRLERRGRTAGFALSLLLLFAYYGLLMLGIALGRRGGPLAPAAPWFADAALLGAGLALWRTRMAR